MSTTAIGASAATGGAGVTAAAAASTPGTAASLPDHHLPNPGVFGPRFRNPWDTYEARGLTHVLRWQRERRQAGLSGDPHLTGIPKPTEADFRRAFPLRPVDWAALAAPPAAGVQAVWVGHATVLVQMGGATFITDPVFSERCAPVQFAGPKRVVPPALTGAEPELPPLDFVLLSHNHYDHLDTASVRVLDKRFGKSLSWYVPLGLGRWFRSEGVAGRVVELDWWHSAEHATAGGGSVTVTMVPAQHWSQRGPLDRFRSLWGGYIVTAQPPADTQAAAQPSPQPAVPADAVATSNSNPAGPDARTCGAAGGGAGAGAGAGQTGAVAAAAQQPLQPAKATASASAEPLRFYFAGDSGYCPAFKEIGARFGPIDLAAIPIGAYEPRWFMKPQHVNAEEGLQIAQDVGARVAIGIHTATWALTDEPLDEPPARLVAAVRARGLAPDSFLTLQHGERAAVVGGRLANSPRTLPAVERPAGEGAQG